MVTAREIWHMLIRARGSGVVAFVKQNDRYALEAQFAGELAQPVDILLHRIADKDQRIDALFLVLRNCVREDTLDLRLAAEARDGAHRPMQIGGGGQPAARLAFTEAAIIDELDVEAAERGGRLEHLALNAAGAIPGGLAARRCIK